MNQFLLFFYHFKILSSSPLAGYFPYPFYIFKHHCIFFSKYLFQSIVLILFALIMYYLLKLSHIKLLISCNVELFLRYLIKFLCFIYIKPEQSLVKIVDLLRSFSFSVVFSFKLFESFKFSLWRDFIYDSKFLKFGY